MVDEWIGGLVDWWMNGRNDKRSRRLYDPVSNSQPSMHPFIHLSTYPFIQFCFMVELGGGRGMERRGWERGGCSSWRFRWLGSRVKLPPNSFHCCWPGLGSRGQWKRPSLNATGRWQAARQKLGGSEPNRLG